MSLTKKEKWLMNIAIRCVNLEEGCDFEFIEILKDNDLVEFYGYEPYPENEFLEVSDEEYEAATPEQREVWIKETDVKEDAWLEQQDRIIEKVQTEVTELLQKLRDQ